MTPVSERLGAVAIVVIAVVAFVALAFGIGYLVGKILL
jgi:hypothetical protein